MKKFLIIGFMLLLFGCSNKIKEDNIDNIQEENNPNQQENNPNQQENWIIQNLDYQETTDDFDNPDMGFYRPISVKVNQTDVLYNENIIKDNQNLYHLRIDISAFSKAYNGVSDLEITDEAIKKLDELFKILNDRSKSAIVRFAYDENYSGKVNQEPNIEMIIKHITKLSNMLNKYPNTITAIEAGLIGPWGEMHSSDMANKECINKIIDCFLKQTELPILVRTPKMIYDYLEITIDDISNYEIKEDSLAYKLGLFNDGFLGSKTDLGTYTNRESEINWIKNQTNHLPFGGEVVAGDNERHNINNCLEEMDLINLTYLNIEWNDTIINEWENDLYINESDLLYNNSTAFKYINNHLGYRFVLNNSSICLNEEKIKIKLDFKNVGFANLNKEKKLRLIFEGEETTYIDLLDSFSINLNLEEKINLNKGSYKVYLKIASDIENDLYNVRLANNLYNSSLNANLIGNIIIE